MFRALNRIIPSVSRSPFRKFGFTPPARRLTAAPASYRGVPMPNARYIVTGASPAVSYVDRLAGPRTDGRYQGENSGQWPRWALGFGLVGLLISNEEEEVANSPVTRCLDELTKKHKWVRKIKVGRFVGLGVALHERVLTPGAKEISGDSIRAAYMVKERQSGNTPVWVEAGGLIELGTHQSLTLPLGVLGDGSIGFGAKSVLEYRALSPAMNVNSLEDIAATRDGTFFLPVSEEELRFVSPGSEFELRGRGRISGGASVGFGPKIVAVGATAMARVGGEVAWEGNLALKVKKMNAEGLVEVTVTRDEKESRALSAKLAAQVAPDYDAVPALGSGFLAAVAKQQGQFELARLVRSYGTLSADAVLSDSSREHVLGRYQVDVGNVEGRKAYAALLGLDLDKADSLSRTAGDAVNSLHYSESSHDREASFRMAWGPRELVLFKALEEEKTGLVADDGVVRSSFRENELTNVAGNFISGKRSLSWDAVSVKEEGKELNTFYNLKFKNKDYVTTDFEVNRFFDFAKALGVKYARESKQILPPMSWLDRVISTRDDTNVDVDLYFTEAGIDRVAAATESEALSAVLKAGVHFDGEAKGLEHMSVDTFDTAIGLVEEYRNIERLYDVEDPAYLLKSCQVMQAYRNVTSRELEVDLPHLKRAGDFLTYRASLVGNSEPKNKRRFFVDLGGETSFGFMPVIVAMAQLAGEKETIINSLKMEGSHVVLEAVSEGRIAWTGEGGDTEVLNMSLS